MKINDDFVSGHITAYSHLCFKIYNVHVCVYTTTLGELIYLCVSSKWICSGIKAGESDW